MSQEALLAFRSKVNGNRELQKQIRSDMADGTLNLMALGKAHGYDFTFDEVKAYLQQQAELSDFELEMVAGGWGKGAQLIGDNGAAWTAAGGRLNNATP